VGSRENGDPKKDLRLPFFGSFFGQAKNEQLFLITLACAYLTENDRKSQRNI
jgi:hypothetical protein